MFENIVMVRLRRLELPLLAKQRPQHCVSTNSTIAAQHFKYTTYFFIIQEKYIFKILYYIFLKITYFVSTVSNCKNNNNKYVWFQF